jgi:chromosomal replication initiator protein
MSGKMGLVDHPAFEEFLAALRQRYGESVYQSWMPDLKREAETRDSVTLSTGSPVRHERLQQQFLPGIREVYTKSVRPVSRINIVLRTSLIESARRIEDLAPARNAGLNGQAATSANGRAQPARILALNGRANGAIIGQMSSPAIGKAQGDHGAARESEMPIGSKIDEAQTFESFAVDDTNALAVAAARHVFDDGAENEVVYFNGPSGVGKSHLLFAIANEHRKRFGPGRAVYLHNFEFQERCVTAVRGDSPKISELQRELLSKSMVLIDDIHLFENATRTQAELLNLLNLAKAAGTRVVLAGESTPARLLEAKINVRLADRLSGGLCVALRPGDAAHRALVLKKRLATTNGPAVADDAVDYIAERFSGSTREAIGALVQLRVAYKDHAGPIGRLEAATALKSRLADASTRRVPTLDEAARAVADAFGLTLEQLMDRGQHQHLVRARHAFVIICRKYLHASFPAIGRFMKRDHTTMMSGFRRGEALLARDKSLQAKLAFAIENLGLGDR